MSYRYDPKVFRGSKARFLKAQPRRNWLGRVVFGRSWALVGFWLGCLVAIWAVFYGSEWLGKPVLQAKAAFEFMRTWWGGLR